MTKPQNLEDKKELLCRAVIKHFPSSDRLYLKDINNANPAILINKLDQLAKECGYTKILARVPAVQTSIFLDSGYYEEAEIPGLYSGQDTACFLGRFLDPERKKEKTLGEIQKTQTLFRKKNNHTELAFLPAGYSIGKCNPDEAENISNFYKLVFHSYPYPICSKKYVADSMHENVDYFAIKTENNFVALAYLKKDPVTNSVEMTDFTTFPGYRGHSFASQLLGCMENDMREKGIQTAYTIARAVSPAMNITFSKAGFTYGGRLINNTDIAGRIESMNVWHKRI